MASSPPAPSWRCHVQGLQAGAGADLEYPLARARLQQHVQAPAGQQGQREVEHAALRVRVRRLVGERRGRAGGADGERSGRRDRQRRSSHRVCPAEHDRDPPRGHRQRELGAARLGQRHRVPGAGRRRAHVEPGVDEQQGPAGRGRTGSPCESPRESSTAVTRAAAPPRRPGRSRPATSAGLAPWPGAPSRAARIQGSRKPPTASATSRARRRRTGRGRRTSRRDWRAAGAPGRAAIAVPGAQLQPRAGRRQAGGAGRRPGSACVCMDLTVELQRKFCKRISAESCL